MLEYYYQYQRYSHIYFIKTDFTAKRRKLKVDVFTIIQLKGLLLKEVNYLPGYRRCVKQSFAHVKGCINLHIKYDTVGFIGLSGVYAQYDWDDWHTVALLFCPPKVRSVLSPLFLVFLALFKSIFPGRWGFCSGHAHRHTLAHVP